MLHLTKGLSLVLKILAVLLACCAGAGASTVLVVGQFFFNY